MEGLYYGRLIDRLYVEVEDLVPLRLSPRPHADLYEGFMGSEAVEAHAKDVEKLVDVSRGLVKA